MIKFSFCTMIWLMISFNWIELFPLLWILLLTTAVRILYLITQALRHFCHDWDDTSTCPEIYQLLIHTWYSCTAKVRSQNLPQREISNKYWMCGSNNIYVVNLLLVLWKQHWKNILYISNCLSTYWGKYLFTRTLHDWTCFWKWESKPDDLITNLIVAYWNEI